MSHTPNVRDSFLEDYLRGLFRRDRGLYRERTIPDPTPTNTTEVARDLKESLEIITRQRGDIMDSALRVRDVAAIVEAVKRGTEADMVTRDFLTEVSKGNIAGHSLVLKYGRNDDIDLGSGFEAIWNGGGDYTGHDPVAAETLEVFSASANDVGTVLSSGTGTGGDETSFVDSGATFATAGVTAGDVVVNDTQRDHGIVRSLTGETQINFWRWDGGTVPAVGDSYRVVTQGSTGAPLCKISFLLDGEFEEQLPEYIVLNGVTAVNTVGQYMRQSRGRCIGGVNAGGITCRQNVTTANVMMVLPAGYASTMIAAYTIPKGKTGYIVNRFVSFAGKVNANSIARLMARPVGCAYAVEEESAVISTGTSYAQREYDAPKGPFKEMTDIKVMADSDTNNVGIAAGFDVLLVDN